jgi:hypothetical protein
MPITPTQLLASITRNVHQLVTRPAINIDGLEDQLSDIQSELAKMNELLAQVLFIEDEDYWQDEQLAYTRLLFDRLLNNFPNKGASELIIEANRDAAKIVNTLKSLSENNDNAVTETGYRVEEATVTHSFLSTAAFI